MASPKRLQKTRAGFLVVGILLAVILFVEAFLTRNYFTFFSIGLGALSIFCIVLGLFSKFPPYHEFGANEFAGKHTVDRLCAAITTDVEFTTDQQTNTIEWLNALLSLPNLYDLLRKGNRSWQSPGKPDQLAQRYMNAPTQDKLIVLNRKLLEGFYRDLTPKKIELWQWTLIMSIVIAGLALIVAFDFKTWNEIRWYRADMTSDSYRTRVNALEGILRISKDSSLFRDHPAIIEALRIAKTDPNPLVRARAMSAAAGRQVSTPPAQLSTIDPQNISQVVKAITESISFLDGIRTIASHFLADGSLAKSASGYGATVTREIQCKDGGSINKTIKNLTAPTEAVRGTFKYEGVYVHNACREYTFVRSGTIRGQFEQLDFISRLVNPPETIISLSDSSIFDTKSNRRDSETGNVKISNITEESGQAILNLDRTTSIGSDMTPGTERTGATYKEYRIKWKLTDSGRTYDISGEIRPYGVTHNLSITTIVPILILKRATVPNSGEIAIKGSRDKIRAVLLDRRVNIYINDKLVQ
jgi:hypothetical protein